MRRYLKSLTIILALSLMLAACSQEVQTPRTAVNSPPASPSPPAAIPTPRTEEAVPITLPVLDALLADEKFRADLKSKLQLTDEQISALRKLSSDEVAKLRRSNAENQPGSAETARQSAIEAIQRVVGTQKSEQLLALAREHWNKGGEELEARAAKEAGPTMLKGPNAVPKDTRIVVNIPAFRMDVFENGSLIKSYKIGIGYPQFPLPIGLRKAQMIIFNPTWTPPDSPWVDSMNVTPGEVIEAGSKQNPLGPIKIPIGSPSLIHGGKPLAKIGTFASHGCVGLTNDEVKDIVRVLAEASNTELKEDTMAAFLRKRTRTQAVKLDRPVPVELRYETIVIEDGRLHVYRDVYNKNTNIEENLRAVFETNGINFDSLGEDAKTQALDAVNAMSLHPKKPSFPKPAMVANQNSADKTTLAAERKAEAERQRKLRNQKEIVIDIAPLSGKGYPPPKDLHTGAGSVASNAGGPKPKPPRRNPTPAPQSTPEAGQTPRNTARPH